MEAGSPRLLWLLRPFQIVIGDEIPGKLEVPLSFKVRLTVELIVGELTSAAVKEFDESAVLLSRIVANLFHVAKLAKNLVNRLVGQVLLGALEHGEEGSLVLVPVAALSLVLLTRQRVVDVDGTSAERSALHRQHGISRRPKVVIGDEGDATLVDHVEERLDLTKLLKLLLECELDSVCIWE